MNREQLFAELSFPARSPACAFALLAFYVLMALAARAGIFGLWLGILVVPAMFRFLVTVAEARAAGTDVEPPGVELFTLGSHAWTLFAVVPALAFAGLVLVLRGAHPLLAAGVGASGALLLPAMITVLVVTHAPLEAFNPAALLRVVRSFGPTYLLAPPMLGLVGIVAAASLPIAWLGHLLVLYLMFAVHALVGGLIREHGLLEAIEIPVDETIGVEMERGGSSGSASFASIMPMRSSVAAITPARSCISKSGSTKTRIPTPPAPGTRSRCAAGRTRHRR